MLNNEIFLSVKNILCHPSLELSSTKNRRDLIFRAFTLIGHPIANKIDFEGDLSAFINNLVTKLLQYGTYNNKHSFILLIESIKNDACQELIFQIDSFLKIYGDSDNYTKFRQDEIIYLNDMINNFTEEIYSYVNLAGDTSILHRKKISKSSVLRKLIKNPILYNISLPKDNFKSEETDDIINTIYESEKCVILGEPGCGKTTSLFRLAVNLSEEALKDSNKPIPIFIPLNLYKGEISFEEFIIKQMSNIGYLFNDYHKNIGKVIFLFDALNEILNSLKELVLKYIFNLPRYVVTCRVKDYNQEFNNQENIYQILILDLDPIRIKKAISLRFENNFAETLWYSLGGSENLLKFWNSLSKHNDKDKFWTLASLPSYTSETEDIAWRKMHEIAILPLCKNPFMLKMVENIFLKYGLIPSNRGELFKTFIDICLDMELKMSYQIKEVKNEERFIKLIKKLTINVLSHLANEIQINKLGTSIAKDQVVNLLSQTFDLDEIETAISSAVDSGLLRTANEQLIFVHQLIQEYFASLILGKAFDNKIPFSNFINKDVWWQTNGWEETAIILTGVRGKNELNNLVVWISECQPELALRCIEECGIPGIKISNIDINLKIKLQEIFSIKMCLDNESLQSRFRIGKALSYLDDPRPGVGVKIINGIKKPDILWSPIINNSFKISIYPITYQQFNLFIEDQNGYNNIKYWNYSKESYKWKNENMTSSNSKYNYSNYPKVYVNWYEAVAFCMWLGDLLNEYIRLPFESEWKSSWGNKSTLFPWGNDFLNEFANVLIDETNSINSPCSVGLFPKGKSSCGIYDLCGNTWEWCYDNKHKLDQNEISTGILKGGSWFYNLDFCNYEYKQWTFLNNQSNEIGFRVLCQI